MRLGSIPFPGPFTLYAVADPGDLGSHRYEDWWEHHDGPPETDRGILYTRRAGFLDLSHIRESVDIVKFTHDRIIERLHQGKGGTFSLTWSDTRYDVVICLPEWWWGLATDERAVLTREAAIRQAQRLAVIIGAWHELGTWYGQMTIPPFSEKNSAFTWDDPCSHVVAATVAGIALRAPTSSWNAAITTALADELTELGVVDIDCESRAVEKVHGRWWWQGTAIRRDLDVGLATNVKTPWLVSGVECIEQGEHEPARLTVADLNVNGHDLRDLFEIRIVPESWLMRKALGCRTCPEALVTEQALLDAIERVRVEVKQEFGPQADQP